jgi:chemotaxis protein methyltransferase CheR
MTSEGLLDSASEVVGRSAGLRLDPAQRHRLDYWLKTTAAQRGTDDASIVQEIAAEGPALQAVLDELTVQETSFFRDRAQFDALRSAVLATLRPPLTVWSAGCAWGQEPYSLAMLLDEWGFPDWRVVASDISSRALRQAQSARYTSHQLTGLTEAERSRWLRKVGDGRWEVVPSLRQRVSVFRHNLVRDPIPRQARGAAVVFCRNVLIYFDRADVLAALERIAETMDPLGWVFLGFSESLWQVTDRFRLIRVGKAFAYRQSEAVGDPEEQRPAPPAAAGAPPPPRADPAARPSDHPRRHAAAWRHASPAPPLSRAAAPRPAADHPVPAGDPGRAGQAHPASSAPEAVAPNGSAAVPSIASLLAEGEAALQSGDAAAAVQALRKAAYLDPDHGVAQFQLGLGFEMLGDHGQARRAFSAARAALGRSAAAAEAALEGYQIGELIRMLDHCLRRART